MRVGTRGRRLRAATTVRGPDAAVAGAASTPAAVHDNRIPPIIKRNTLLLAASQAIVGTGNQMVPTLTAIMIEQLLKSATFAGFGYSALGISRFLIAYPLGRLSDRFGRRISLLLGLALGLLGALGLSASHVLQSFPLFCFTLIVFGLGVGAAQQLRLAAADMYPPHRRAEGLGYVLTGSLVGAMGGPLLISAAQGAGPQLGLDAIAAAWLFVPAFLVPSMVLVALVRPDPRDIALNLAKYYPQPAPVGAPTGARPKATEDRFASPRYARRTAFANSAAAQGTMSMMMALTPLSMSHHGHGLSQISLAVALHVLGMYAFSLPIGRLTDKLGRRPMLQVGGVISAIGALLVPLSPEYWVATAGLFLVGLGWSFSSVAATAVVADITAPTQRGRVLGTNDTLAGAAAVATPILGGLLVQGLGLGSLGVAGVALLAAPFAMTLTLKETGRAGATIGA